MDTPEHADQVMQKLTHIESQLWSLRYTFGIGIIVMAVFLTLLVPGLVRDFPMQDAQQAPQAMEQFPGVQSEVHAPAAEAPMTSTTTTTTTTSTTTTP